MLRSVVDGPIPDVLTYPPPEESGTHRVVIPNDRIGGVTCTFAGELDVDPAEDITLEAPSPKVPAGVPSPLGDDEEPPSTQPSHEPADDEECDVHLFVRGPHETPSTAPAAPRAVREAALQAGVPAAPDPPRRLQPFVRRRPSDPPPGLMPSSMRPRLSREVVDAARAARELARETTRREQAKTRVIVLSIWGAAVVLGGLLGFFAVAAS